MDSVYTILKRMIKTGYLMRDKTLDLEFQERIIRENRGDLNEKLYQ